MHSLALLFISNLFSSDMLIIVFVALLLFGGEKLPEIARGLGKGIRDFKDASEGIKREINDQINSYEVSKEDKKTADAIVANQLAAQNQPTVIESTGQPVESPPVVIESTPSLADNHTPVANTMPLGDFNFNQSGSTATENHAEHQAVPVNEESHTGMAHVHTDAQTTTEPIKNS
jgi:sec-independent protein translocase protein TatA